MKINMTIEIQIYKRKLTTKKINIDDSNYFLVRFMLENEIESIRRRLKIFEKKKIIKNIKSIPKDLDMHDSNHKKIKDLSESRRSILSALRSMRRQHTNKFIY